MEASHDEAWLEWACLLQKKMIELFWDQKRGGFYSTTDADETILLRMKEGELCMYNNCNHGLSLTGVTNCAEGGWANYQALWRASHLLYTCLTEEAPVMPCPWSVIYEEIIQELLRFLPLLVTVFLYWNCLPILGVCIHWTGLDFDPYFLNQSLNAEGTVRLSGVSG